MNTFRMTLLIILLALPCLILGAGDETAEKERKAYSSSTSFSTLIASGNTNNLNLSMETRQTLQFDRDRFDLNAGIIYARSKKEKQSEIITASFQYRRRFNPRAYFLAQTTFIRNILSGIDSRLVFSAGAGYKWIHHTRMDIVSEISIGWSREKTREEPGLGETGSRDLDPEKDGLSFLTTAVSSRLDYRISDSAELMHSESLFFNMDFLPAYRIESRTSISGVVSRNLALKISFQILHENRPVPGFKRTDLLLLSSIVVNL